MHHDASYGKGRQAQLRTGSGEPLGYLPLQNWKHNPMAPGSGDTLSLSRLSEL